MRIVRSSTWMVVVVLAVPFAIAFNSPAAWGQPMQWSQRPLPVPEGTSMDLLNQFRLMQDLQRQLQQNNHLPIPPLPRNELLERMRDALPPRERELIDQALEAGRQAMPDEQRQSQQPAGATTASDPRENVDPWENEAPRENDEPGERALQQTPRERQWKEENRGPPRGEPRNVVPQNGNRDPRNGEARDDGELSPSTLQPPRRNRSVSEPMMQAPAPREEASGREPPGGVPRSRNETQPQGATPTESRDASAGDAEHERDRDRDQNIRERLARDGLKGTLQELVQQAREEAKQPTPAAAAAQGNLTSGTQVGKSGAMKDAVRSALLSSLAGAREDLQELAKELRQSKEARSSMAAARPPRSAPPARVPARSAPPGAPEPSVAARATEWFRDLTEAPEPPPVESAAVLTTNASSSRGAFFWIIAWVVVGIAGVAIYRRRMASAGGRTTTASAKPVRITHVRSREDIMAAFDYVIATAETRIERWWSHAHAARVLSVANPEAVSAIQQLTELYEIARYAPRDRPLTADQLNSAERALERLSAC